MSFVRLALVLALAALAGCDSDSTRDMADADTAQTGPPGGPTLNVSAIAISEHADPCVLLGDGTIRCGGRYAQRVAGDGSTAGDDLAVMHELSNAVALAVGASHACAVLDDGTVRCWGANDRAQLGNRSGEVWSLPVVVEGISDAVAIDAAEETTCVVTRRATVVCWGGLEEYFPGPGPTELPGLQGVIDVALGSLRDQVSVLTSDGGVLTWGEPIGSGSGVAEVQLGPVIPGAVELDAGQFHLCARTDAGQVQCWGSNNEYGVLGRDSNLRRSAEPLLIDGWSDVVALGAGESHNCVVRADGSVWCWGRGSRGNLGDGQEASSSVPVQVNGVENARALSRGGEGSCAILADTSALCWGDIAVRRASATLPSPI